MTVLEFIDREGSPLYHLEHFIEGEYNKYNSNSGFVDETHCRSTPHVSHSLSHHVTVCHITPKHMKYQSQHVKYQSQHVNYQSQHVEYQSQPVECQSQRFT